MPKLKAPAPSKVNLVHLHSKSWINPHPLARQPILILGKFFFYIKHIDRVKRNIKPFPLLTK